VAFFVAVDVSADGFVVLVSDFAVSGFDPEPESPLDELFEDLLESLLADVIEEDSAPRLSVL
jgi:hypothetical protein